MSEEETVGWDAGAVEEDETGVVQVTRGLLFHVVMNLDLICRQWAVIENLNWEVKQSDLCFRGTGVSF